MKSLLLVLLLIGASLASPDNNIAVGYQIGGYTLVGVDYEIRMSDHFGVHFGGGLAGGTLGFRIHTGDDTHSPFIGVNLKDGGFGLINVVAAQFGGTWEIGDEHGLRYEVGLHQILKIDKDLERTIYGNDKAPPIGLSLGLGWAW